MKGSDAEGTVARGHIVQSIGPTGPIWIWQMKHDKAFLVQCFSNLNCFRITSSVIEYRYGAPSLEFPFKSDLEFKVFHFLETTL